MTVPRVLSPFHAPKVVVAATLLLVGVALLFSYTLAPGLLWGDDAMFQMSLATGALTSHPVWGILGRLWAAFPYGDVAFRANLASASYAVAASGFLFFIVFSLTDQWQSSLLAGLALSLSHAFWLHAVRAEVYSLHVFLFLTGLWALLQWRQRPGSWGWLVLAALVWLVGIANHLLMALVLPGGLWLVVHTFPASPGRRTWLRIAVGIVVAALLLYLAFPSVLSEVLPRSVRYVLSAFRMTPRRLATDAVLLVYQFPFTGLLIPAGMIFLWRHQKPVAIGLALMALPTALFAAAFDVPDSYVYFLPVYALLALLAGLGGRSIASHPAQDQIALGVVLVVLQIALYRATPLILDRFAPTLLGARDLPGRPANEFFLWPPKRGHDGARRFAEDTLRDLPAQAIIAADWTLFTPLMYLQTVEGWRPDVRILEMSSAAIPILLDHRQDRPLYLADDYAPYYALDEFLPYFELKPSGSVFQLIPRSAVP
jgi:hypothetical protein